jgi:uncharacterized protein
MEPWIETFTGKQFWFTDPFQICIEDIAGALSKICRFTGHCSDFYSVAEHSVLVSFLVPKELQLSALLHDASEAYLSDISSPLKEMLPRYKKLEKTITESIGYYFKLPKNYSKLYEVKLADHIQLKEEANLLIPSKGSTWNFPDTLPRGITPKLLTPKQAEVFFLERFKDLINE